MTKKSYDLCDQKHHVFFENENYLKNFQIFVTIEKKGENYKTRSLKEIGSNLITF